MRDVSIYGVGSSQFGKQPDVLIYDLAWQACQEAWLDAAVDTVDAVFVGTAYAPLGTAQRVLHGLGIVEVPIVTLENACASATSAYHEAYEAIRRGRYETVLALGIEQMTQRSSGAISPEDTDPEGRMGVAMLARYAMMTQRYMHVYGVAIEDIAQVAVKSSRNGARNDRAQHSRELSLEEVLDSRLIADPLTLFQCCSISDGAAAAVLGPRRSSSRDVAIRGSAMVSGGLWDYRSDDLLGINIVRRATQAALDQAGCTVDDIDVFEVHDAFTIGEIMTIEAIGIVKEGLGAQLVREGFTEIHGEKPVNPSGGLLARGHPLGATGLAQIAEIVWQLRGNAEERQVANTALGLVETAGGGVSGIDGNACVVTILESS
jgi:acetyl-CoA acetyltransferase